MSVPLDVAGTETGEDPAGSERRGAPWTGAWRPRQGVGLVLLFGLLVLASRLPLAPGQLFSFDDVNFAYAIGEFDPRLSQPQPPGYPLFVLQTRILFWLRFKRPESNLTALALLGSVAAVLATAWAGRGMFGAPAGLCAAWLLLFHHSFWYAGLTSGLRPQLALVSAGVAAACWRAWQGHRGWVYGSAAALSLGAGIRPEMGLLLLPLWVTSVMRSGAPRRDRWSALALSAGIVACWLLPTALASGGLKDYLLLCRNYLVDQSSLTSAVFGAPPELGYRSIAWLAVWGFTGLLTWPVLGALGWRRREGWGLGTEQVRFLLLWLLPCVGFAAFVHVADAGQALGLVPILCIVGGHLMHRAARRLAAWIPAEHALLFLFLCSLAVNLGVFFGGPWYYEARPESGWRGQAERLQEDLFNGLNQTSLAHVRGVAWLDDWALNRLGELQAVQPDRTVVVWERGRTSWRKAAYYFPSLPVIVLDANPLNRAAQPVVQVMMGPRVRWGEQAPAPLRVPLPSNARVIWMLDPKTEFFRSLAAAFSLQFADPLYYTDLPDGPREALVRPYRFEWSSRVRSETPPHPSD